MQRGKNVWYDAYKAQLMVSFRASLETNTVTYCESSTHLYTGTESVSWKVDWMLWCFTVGAESSPDGDAGGRAHEGVLDALCKWLWWWWRSCFTPARQVRDIWASVIHCVVLGVLVLVEDTYWMAAVTDWSVGPSSTHQDD